MKDCSVFKRFINVFEGRIREHIPTEEMWVEKSDGYVTRFSVRIKERDESVVFRVTNDVRELTIMDTQASDAVAELLKSVGLEGIASIMTRWGYVPKSVTISYVQPSKALYLLIEGVRGRVPTVRVIVRDNTYEASASYCVISDGENVCAYLAELVNVLKDLRECIITYAQ